MKCGCEIAPGRRVCYSELRSHFEHVKEGIEDAMARVLMLEMIVGINHDMDIEPKLAEVRFALSDALTKWEDGAFPELNKKYPENKLAEALGL